MENHPDCVLRDDILVSCWRQRRRRMQDHQSSSQVSYCLGDLMALQGWKLHVSASEPWEHMQTHYWVTELFEWTVKSWGGGSHCQWCVRIPGLKKKKVLLRLVCFTYQINKQNCELLVIYIRASVWARNQNKPIQGRYPKIGKKSSWGKYE